MTEQTQKNAENHSVGRSDSNAGLGLLKPDTNVQDIVRDWLKLNGFDGLVNEHHECGCHLDDFIICGGDGGSVPSCRPAYKFNLKNGDWWMHTNKHWVEPEDDDA